MKTTITPTDDVLDSSFATNSEPMWVFDCQTLAFLEVNEAAICRYGYSRKEFLDMTILDIRPIEDLQLLLRQILNPHRPGGRVERLWRHQRKDGTIFRVEIASREITFNGRSSELVTASAHISNARPPLPRNLAMAQHV